MKITVLDLGSFDGFSPIWDKLGENVELIGVDPFVKNKINFGKFGRKEIIFNNVVGDIDEEDVDFYVSEFGQASSLLKENSKLVSRFHAGKYGKIVRKEKVSVKEIKKLLESQNIKKFDFLKIDVEGYELKLLNNLKDILKKDCLGIQCECFFQEYHIGRPLFSDIEIFLRELGYHVFDISLEKWGRLTNQIEYPVDHRGVNRGGNAQVMWADVLFLKDPILDEDKSLNRMEREKREKMIILSELYNQKDFADELKYYYNI